MKKITQILLSLSFTVLFAQAPQKMSYQSVVRKTDGTLIAGTLINIKTSILFGSATGLVKYVETQKTTTNNNGLATIEIGGGTSVTGTFDSIDWGTGSYFIKTEIDPTGGTNFTISGTSQLLSVPYALYAGNSQSKGKSSIILTGDVTDEEAASQIAAELGPYTENVYVTNTTNLTTLNLSGIKRAINIAINDNLKLVNINLDNLSQIFNDCNISRNENLSSISFPVLKMADGYDFDILDNPSLKSISCPSLVKVNGIYFSNNFILSSIDLPILSSIGLSKGIGFSKNALPSSQINLILNRLLKLSSSPTYIQLQSQNPLAPPTAQGINDKATLISRGYDVRTD